VSSNISTTSGAQAALDAIKTAITQLSSDRATVGSYETRLNYASNQLEVGNENLTSANSKITDVNVADESTTYATQNILVQSSTAMLAQANQLPQTVLKLLQ
jgi:flagellin